METDLKDHEVQGLKYFKRLLPLLDRLHEVGCERDTSGNRKLFFDGYVKLILLYMWNPLIGSMRTLQKVLDLPRVFKVLGLERFSLGSFSESPRVFEPQKCKAIIEELAGELRPLSLNPRLSEVKRALRLADGTILQGLSGLARAATDYGTARNKRSLHGWRLHLQLNLKTFSPSRMDLTGARNAGSQRENNVLKASLEKDVCYVGDCGYSDRSLLDAIATAQSSYVMRVREDSTFDVIEERELSQEVLDAGVVRDAIVVLGGAKAKAMNHPVRLVEVQVTPRPRRVRKSKKKPAAKSKRLSDRLLMVTDMTGAELGPQLVALVYQQRYSVELFFRFFKQILGMRHLLSQCKEGVEIQVYCAIIACLVIQLETGRKPDKRTVEMMGWFFLGLATEQDVIDHLNKPDNRGVKNRARDERRKKLGY